MNHQEHNVRRLDEEICLCLKKKKDAARAAGKDPEIETMSDEIDEEICICLKKKKTAARATEDQEIEMEQEDGIWKQIVSEPWKNVTTDDTRKKSDTKLSLSSSDHSLETNLPSKDKLNSTTFNKKSEDIRRTSDKSSKGSSINTSKMKQRSADKAVKTFSTPKQSVDDFSQDEIRLHNSIVIKFKLHKYDDKKDYVLINGPIYVRKSLIYDKSTVTESTKVVRHLIQNSPETRDLFSNTIQNNNVSSHKDSVESLANKTLVPHGIVELYRDNSDFRESLSTVQGCDQLLRIEHNLDQTFPVSEPSKSKTYPELDDKNLYVPKMSSNEIGYGLKKYHYLMMESATSTTDLSHYAKKNKTVSISLETETVASIAKFAEETQTQPEKTQQSIEELEQVSSHEINIPEQNVQKTDDLINDEFVDFLQELDQPAPQKHVETETQIETMTKEDAKLTKSPISKATEPVTKRNPRFSDMKEYVMQAEKTSGKRISWNEEEMGKFFTKMKHSINEEVQQGQEQVTDDETETDPLPRSLMYSSEPLPSYRSASDTAQKQMSPSYNGSMYSSDPRLSYKKDSIVIYKEKNLSHSPMPSSKPLPLHRKDSDNVHKPKSTPHKSFSPNKSDLSIGDEQILKETSFDGIPNKTFAGKQSSTSLTDDLKNFEATSNDVGFDDVLQKLNEHIPVTLTASQEKNITENTQQLSAFRHADKIVSENNLEETLTHPETSFRPANIARRNREF